MRLARVGASAALAAAWPHVATAAAPDEDDLTLFSVILDGTTLTEAMTAYETTEDPLLPLGELSRLLDLDIRIAADGGQAAGTIGEAQEALTVDIPTGVARAGGEEIMLPAGDVAVTETDIYLRASLMERLLPLRFRIEPEFLQITLTATAPLPIQERAERAARRDSLSAGAGAAEPVLRADVPYRLLSPPAFDVALEAGYDSLRDLTARRYDVRAAADLLGAAASLYVGSDVEGRPSSARVLLERRWARTDGDGVARGVEAAAGDVFTPLMTLGPRSAGGRGIAVSAGALGSASAFQRITLRGELPLGYDVELYVNDVLRSGQRVPVEGRYEFVDVPLSQGVNVLRIVTYSPRGERSEDTQVLNVGGGGVERGAVALEFGAVQQDRPVIVTQDGDISDPGPQHGEWRVAANVIYGLRDNLSLAGGAATWADPTGTRHDMLTAGLRGSMGGVALLADAASDLAIGGTALSVGAAGEALGVSLTLRHLEYGGGFLDEANAVLDLARLPRRRSEANASFDLNPVIGAGVPVSVRAEHTRFADGGTSSAGMVRASAVIWETLSSAGWDYTRDRAAGVTVETMTGELTASRYVNFTWRTRAALDYLILPDLELSAFSISADRNLSDEFGVGFGAGRTFGEDADVTLQASAFARLPFGDITLSGDYAVEDKDWRVGLRLSFGIVTADRPRLTRPGVATSGSAMLTAFIDRDGDGVFDADEDGAAGVTLSGGERPATTGSDGRAFVGGLGDGAQTTLRADIGGADLFYVQTPPEAIVLTPRPGATASIPYPLAPAGEVYARLFLVRADGSEVGLSAVRARLVRPGADPVTANTAFDGTAVFADVRPGVYALEIDPDQAQRLGMALAAPVSVAVAADGFAPDVEAQVLFRSFQPAAAAP